MLSAVTFQIINALGWQATKCLILKCQRLTERGEGGRGVLMKVLYREFPPEGNTLPFYIECFHTRGQHLRKFIGTKESVHIRKEFNS